MDSFIPMGGFQLPFQRRLSRLYNDTKKSSDFVKEPVQNEEDPEMKALHRKLRIQKDRLVSWGLEWSDPNQSAEIDESLSKAGLSEVVGSIMSTIKDILAEAEPLWQSSKHVVTASRASPDRKAPLVQWDKGRFEDLIRDLTASIDTLYDLSRTRASGYFPRRMSKATYKSPVTDEFRPFESSRMRTPQQIDPATLTHLRPKQQGDATIPPREVVFMSKTAYSEMTLGTTTKEPWAPLLLEYATFDSIYSVTGIMPPMSRFEKLSSGLQQDPQRAPGTWTGLPRLLGYFEDMENSRIGLVYRFPPSFNAVSFERLTQNPLYNLPTLNDLLSRQDEPPLEAKFRLAYNLTNTVFDMHARGVTHGNLAAKNISFCDASTKDSGAEGAIVDVRRPLVSSFDLFPEDEASSQVSPWRHPLDPRSSRRSPINQSTDERILELYSLAMVLLSIGLWTKLEALLPDSTSSIVPGSALDRLAVKCGTLYMKAVQACWHAVDDELNGQSGGETLLSTVQMQATRFLETCCILDGVSGLEERLDQELRDGTVTQQQVETTKDAKSPSGYPADKKAPLPPTDSNPRQLERMEPVEADFDGKEASVAGLISFFIDTSTEVQGKQKMRLYPHVPLPPDVVDKWNTILMPQINQALRHFYRKHPESVEISLESVGPSPHATQPTVLVVCTSVGKVRAILKKRIGELFDGTTGFALKVCRGHVLRSRRFSKSVFRSMARSAAADSDGEDEIEAVNPEYQECPGNGASIGAWIGDRHLPPVSFGGLVLVDEKPYGMTVHHMLDDPDRDAAQLETLRSSAAPGHDWYAEFMESSGDDEEDYAYELSDTESEPYSETDITSDYGDEDEEEDEFEPGDIPGIEPGCGDGYVVTQPALDDVEEGFYPCAETEDEDHLDTFSLGEVYASSGIRRKQAHGLTHEVDWALFEFADGRLPGDNTIPRCDAAGENGKSQSDVGDDLAKLRPTTVAPSSSLPGMEVQCVARTSGLQTGQILPALTSVKIYGRCSPSHTYQVASTPTAGERQPKSRLPMGIPGDSGAWVIDRRHGQLCGHVLAWSQRKRVAYICPMDVLLLDVAQTLEASEVRLPGGEPVVTLGDPSEYQEANQFRVGEDDEDLGDLVDEEEEAPALAAVPNATRHDNTGSSPTSLRSSSNQESSSPLRLETSSELRGLASRLEDLNIGRTQRIGVSG
ncbi:HET-s/LopB domain-containing protein [Pochonia chlamydosporia 170]|uniref:HET-s/LopB domain-containing protein n=1 Tax=Pochonia chlamydosporia 170 TaxID=1380566 RepID=A0A179F815_METCM|nr:HET-s/LopB domain-containing protein [Pochonia chlamydosporia 170]OAQ61239.2 HET-s/LopB domain-containing protein [Pochonia chlamydosporia 170]